VVSFLRAIAECIVCLSHRLGVCLFVRSVCHTRDLYQARITKFSPLADTRTLVYHDKISCPWVKRFPSNEGVKEGYPLEKMLFCHYWLF